MCGGTQEGRWAWEEQAVTEHCYTVDVRQYSARLLVEGGRDMLVRLLIVDC